MARADADADADASNNGDNDDGMQLSNCTLRNLSKPRHPQPNLQISMQAGRLTRKKVFMKHSHTMPAEALSQR